MLSSRAYLATTPLHCTRHGKDAYLPLLQALDTPFVDAVLHAEDWERYRRYLIRQIDLPLFGETFGLRQIYVPP
jgi:hypothetical protein